MNRKLLTSLLAGAMVWGCGAQSPSETSTPAPETAAAAPNDFTAQVAVVTATDLLKQHPDYPKLEELEKQLHTLEQERDSIPESERIKRGKGQRDTFQHAMEEARAQMEAEKAAIDREMSGLALSLQAKAQAEMTAMKAGWDAKIKAEIAKIAPAPPPQPVALQAQPGEVMLLASRNIAARKLELEKANRADLAAERSRLDNQMSAFEDQISARYQEEKLNLQLKLQNSPPEDVEKATRDRLNAIDDEAVAAKSEKRREIDSAMQSYTAKRQAEFDAAVEAYSNRVKSDIRQQVPQAAPQQRPQPSAEQQARVKAYIAQAEAQMRSEMEHKKAEIEGAMKGKENEARARLVAKKEQVEARLRSLQEQMQSEMRNRGDFLSAEGKKKLAQVEKNLEKAQADRKQVYDKMLQDLRKAVGEAAESKGIPVVIGQYEVNNGLTDLTDLSMIRIKQL